MQGTEGTEGDSGDGGDAPAKRKGEFSWAAIGVPLVALVACLVPDGGHPIVPNPPLPTV
jgi:hypothetical protein